MNRNVSSFEQSTLGTAMITGDIDMVRWMLKHGASPDIPTENISPLCLASHFGLEYVQAMLDAGANPNIHCHDCEWGCALSRASSDGDISVVKALLEAGADPNPNFARPDVRSPLEWSITGLLEFGVSDRHRWLCCMGLLLEHGADANAPRRDPFEWQVYDSMLEAAVTGYLPESARLLVEHGADIKTPLKLQGYDTILEYAVEKGDVDFTQLLIKRGADVHSPMKVGKYGSLLAAATLAPDSSIDMVKFLIEDAHVGLEQLEWSLPPQEKPVTRAWKLSEEQERSKAQRAKYLIDVHKVDPQVLIDLES
jgi:ankyrin repeat protein